jgi:hypothetical protein
MNVETGTEAAQFSVKEYIKGIFLAVQQSEELSLSSPRVKGQDSNLKIILHLAGALAT